MSALAQWHLISMKGDRYSVRGLSTASYPCAHELSTSRIRIDWEPSAVQASTIFFSEEDE
jgi:hypothetical protein